MNSYKDLSLSVVIPTKDRRADLEACLDSVFEQTFMPFEVIVIDSGQPGSRSYFESKYTQIRYVEFMECTGLTQAKNKGADMAGGSIVLFLDDDLVIDNMFIEKILEIFRSEEYQSICGISGDIINQKNRDGSFIQRMLKIIFLLPMYGNGRLRISASPTFVYGDPNIKQVEFLPGGLTAYRKEIGRASCRERV